MVVFVYFLEVFLLNKLAKKKLKIWLQIFTITIEKKYIFI